MKIASLLLVAFAAALSTAQNVIETTESAKTAPPIVLSERQARECIDRIAVFGGKVRPVEARRIQQKLDTHVREFLEGAPWMPFHHTLGISGYEAYFNHPDELFYTLSISLPFLSPEIAATARDFLNAKLQELPPYSIEGYPHRQGRPREPYQVPDDLRRQGNGKARTAFGIYAFWAYSHYTGQSDFAKSHWPAVKARIKPLLEAEYGFDIYKLNYAGDEAEKLNGDLAALIGFARLARLNSESQDEERAVTAVRYLLELRINLERVNSQILEKTAATKSLHISKLARYCSLAPEIADAAASLSDGCGPARLRTFRQVRNAWHLAFGDRMIGGENYTNPLHFSRALFAGAVFFEQLSFEDLFPFIDVPWCKGDLSFIEKCAYALWAAEGRRFESPP